MRYWNKRRQFQQAGWHRVTVTRPLIWHDLKIWCQQQPGRGKFYSGPYGRRVWYFELESDATWFALDWL